MSEPMSVENLLYEVVPTIDPNVPSLPNRAFLGQLEMPTLRGGISEKEGKAPRPWLSLNIMVTLDDEEAASILDNPTPAIPYSLMLDCKDDNGSIRIDTSMGKNQRLSRLLEAFGLNDGKHTIADLAGKQCLATPGQEEGQDGIKRNRIMKLEAYT